MSEIELTPQSKPQPTKSIKKSKRGFALGKIITAIIAILFIGFVIVSVYFGYSEYQNITQQNKTLRTKTDELDATVLKLQQNQQTLQNTLKQLRQIDNLGYYLNLLSTTDQLVTAANIAIKTENNIEKALDLLNTAILRIRNVHEFSQITQILENDISAIESSHYPDSEKIITQLNQVAQQINTLSQALAPPPTITQTTKENVKLTNTAEQSIATPTTSHKILDSITKSLRNVVIISHKENIPLALTSAQLINLKLNLHALLLEAVLATRNHQTKTYQTNLKEVIDLLQTYFSANEEVKSALIPTIQQLLQIDISSTKLNLDKSLKLIEITLEQKSVSDITTN